MFLTILLLCSDKEVYYNVSRSWLYVPPLRGEIMDSLNLNVNMVTDLIASKTMESGSSLSVLKLQKLLYYTEAWHVTFFEKQLFDENFEAWIHGPVCKEVFYRFRNKNKFMYSAVCKEDLDLSGINQDYEKISSHISNVLGSYGNLSGPQLEELSHREEPWLKARGDLSPSQPCNKVISKDSMKKYYSKLLVP